MTVDGISHENHANRNARGGGDCLLEVRPVNSGRGLINENGSVGPALGGCGSEFRNCRRARVGSADGYAVFFQELGQDAASINLVIEDQHFDPGEAVVSQG